MTKQKISIYFICLAAAIAALGVLTGRMDFTSTPTVQPTEIKTKYGSFLAAQHAIYVNDFDAASKFTNDFADVEYTTVKNTRILSDFLAGKMPSDADMKMLKKEKSTTSRMIYDAHLVRNNAWEELYQRHAKDNSALFAPLRIWSAINLNRKTETLKFIDKLPTNDSWKAFIRGQIFVEQGNIKQAAEEFANVKPEFMNLMDYLYLMSFYYEFGYYEDADILRDDFVSTPSGMFLANYQDIPKWSVFAGSRNALSFNLIQTVSHTKVMLYSDIALLMLRFAEITGNNEPIFADAIKYYSGQFLYNIDGNFVDMFNKINRDSPFYSFGQIRIAEKENNMRLLKKILRHQPLFVPALERMVAGHIQIGNKHGAIKTINKALNNKELPDFGRAYLLKRRAYVYMVFDDFKAAQADIHDATKLSSMDAEILSIQSRIWAAQGKKLDDAYDYSMALIKKNPTDIFAWDTVGSVVLVREGPNAALEIYEQVSKTANSCSSLFEHTGDVYSLLGDKQKAKNAYLRAIDLASDGLVIVAKIEKKIRKLK